MSSSANGCQKGHLLYDAILIKQRLITYMYMYVQQKHTYIFFMQYDTVLKAVKEAVKRFGKIDILVNSNTL